MAKNTSNFTELTHRVVRESSEPLPFAEIMQRVQAITPITTRNPKGTIRNAVSQSRLIVATGDRRYGWKPRVITGSVLRLTLSETDLADRAIVFGDELRDALWPAFFESQKRGDRTPVHLKLPNGTVTQLPLEFLGPSRWGTRGSPEFWAWLDTLGSAPGDHLIFRVVDGEARLYSVEFQPRATRDEAAIVERNRVIVQAALAFLRRKTWGAPIWDIASHLLATGQYKHPTPPDPLSEIWTREVWEPDLEKKSYTGGWTWARAADAELNLDPVLVELAKAIVPYYDYDNPPDLPREYDPDFGRRIRPSRRARRGPVKSFTLRVNHRALPKVWRDIEIAEDQTLEDLHLIIQRAYDWGDDHLYSFFISGRADDRASEIGSPWSEARVHTHQVEIGSLNLKPGQKFLYYFDYGDSHEFDVQVLRINPSAPKGSYPKIVARQGTAPPQYPDYDEETGEMEWNPYWQE